MWLRERLLRNTLYEIGVRAKKIVEAETHEPKTNLCYEIAKHIEEKHNIPLKRYEVSALNPEDPLASNTHFVNESGDLIIDTQLEQFGYLKLDKEFIKKYVYPREEYEQRVPKVPCLNN